MATAAAQITAGNQRPVYGAATVQILSAIRKEPAEVLALTLAVWCVPLSIAVTEFFLALALGCRIFRCAKGQDRIALPRAFWFWLGWAGLTCVSVAFSPDPSAGWGAIRRLFLVATLFVVVPSFKKPSQLLFAWKGVFVTSTLGSLFLIGDAVSRWFYYHRELAAGGDPGFYLRSGGLLNHWMVFGTVEIVVVGGMAAFWFAFPRERRAWSPAILINGLAILASLTRMIWISSFVIFGLALLLRRSRWLWALPALALGLCLFAPGAIGSRLRDTFRADYYSNFERIQMLRVGWSMIQEHPIAGIGAGQVEKQYTTFLTAHDPVPAYRGHLHNNLAQIAAEYGVPTAAAGLLFCVILLVNLGKRFRTAVTQDDQFLSLTALLAFSGFLVAGIFDYTYGHSLALILLAFAVLPALENNPWSGQANSQLFDLKNNPVAEQARRAEAPGRSD